MEAIAIRLEAITTSRVEAIAIGLEAIASSSKKPLEKEGRSSIDPLLGWRPSLLGRGYRH